MSKRDVPEFNENGLLPEGTYELTLNELRYCRLVLGEGLDTNWRCQLVYNFSRMAEQLHEVGVNEIFVDGSFVEDKIHPNDIDGFFICDFYELISGDLTSKLNDLDENKIWTWAEDRKIFVPEFNKRKLPMWIKYQVELFPHYENGPFGAGPMTGILNESGRDTTFTEGFRLQRGTYLKKGIVKIIKDHG